MIVKYLVVIEKGRRSWGAHVPDLPGCVAVAKTRAQLLKLIKGTLEFHIEGLKEAGDKVPFPRSEGTVISIKSL